MTIFRRLHLALRAFCLYLWYGDHPEIDRLREENSALAQRLSELDATFDSSDFRPPIDRPNSQSLYDELVSHGRIKPSGWIDTTRHGEP